MSRVDWRFLLPYSETGAFRHLVVLGGPTGLDHRLLELGVAKRVATSISGDGETDALILLANSHVRPAAVAASLAQNAVLYWEIAQSPSLRRSGLIRRQLRLAGLAEVQAYWVTPDFQHARRYLPLDRPGPIEWFIRTRFVAATPTRLALQMLLTASRGRSHRVLRVLGPSIAIVAARGGAGRAAPAALAAESALPVVGTEHADLVLLTSGQDDGSRVVAVPFREGEREPAVVLKMARVPGFTARSEREHSTLEHLQTRLPPPLRRSLPSPLGSVGRNGGRVFLESMVGGQMMATSVGRWRASPSRQVEDLRLAADWLSAFHQATRARTMSWDRHAIASWIDRPLADYIRELQVGEPERSLFARVRERALDLAGLELPVVLVHNDFNPWHVYRSGERISVIDWEFVGENLAERQGLPLCDLIYFATHWYHLARGLRDESSQLRGFRHLFLSHRRRNRARDAARRAFLGYCGAVGIAPGFVPLLVVCTWVERAVDRQRRRLDLESSASDARRDNRFARYVEILAEGADDLFAIPWALE